MMHKHVLIFFNDVYWCTRKDNDWTKVDCILVYRGKCRYIDTVELTDVEYEGRKDYFEGVRKHFLATTADRTQKQRAWSDWLPSEVEDADEHCTMQGKACTMHENSKDCNENCTMLNCTMQDFVPITRIGKIVRNIVLCRNGWCSCFVLCMENRKIVRKIVLCSNIELWVLLNF